MIIPNAYLCYWCHLYFLGIAFVLEMLGTGGLKLLLKGFQAYHSIGCDQDEGAV